MSTRVTRYWPLALAVLGIAMLAWSGWRLVSAPPVEPDVEDVWDEEDEDEEAPPTDLAPGERWEEVRAQEVDVFQTFKGRVQAEGTVEVRAPAGMRVPVVEIHAEVGEFVDAGDPVVTLDRGQVEDSLRRAREAGRDGDAERFEGYLEHVVLRAPVDGQVLRIWTEEGQVPFDEGIPLVTLTDRSTWSFVVLLPEDVARVAAPIGTRLDVVLEHDLGTVKGTVNSLGETSQGDIATVGGYVSVVIGLDQHEGVEPDLGGVVRVPSSRLAAALVPKRAVEWREDVPVVRVWEDGGILERTLRIEREEGDDYVALYGVAVGERIVVPTAER